MPDLDFPNSPVLYQIWTSPIGTVYIWNGDAWAIGTFDSQPTTQGLSTLGDLIAQIRYLLQDNDIVSAEYRYSTDSIVLAINQGMLELYRLRPDIFLGLGFVVPQFTANNLLASIAVEQQYAPPLIWYAVGLVQARDNEETQDARSAMFLSRFVTMVMSVNA